MEKLRRAKPHMAGILAFVIFIYGLTALDLATGPTQISLAERRKLAQRPELSLASAADGTFSKEYSTYLQDQIVGRDHFRSIKSFISRQILRNPENNGVYVVGDSIYDVFYGINQGYIDRAVTLISAILDSISFECDGAYVGVIPSKAQGLEGKRYLLSDQRAIADALRGVTKASHIDLMPLSEDDTDELYYRTDHHWTTQGTIRAYELVGRGMGYVPIQGYSLELGTDSYYGNLYGRAAMTSIPPDSVYLAHNEMLDNMSVCRYKTLDDIECQDSIYYREELDGLDPYDVFIGGAAPITVIENPLAPAGTELVIFKDSYSHALAPFLAQHFPTTMLIDLRYVRKELIFEVFDLDGKIILFLFSTTILNTDPRILN